MSDELPVPVGCLRFPAISVLALFHGLFVSFADCASIEKTSVVELKSPVPEEFPSILVSIGSDVRTSVDHPVDDCVIFELKKMRRGHAIARMGVYLGGAPPEFWQNNPPIHFEQTPEKFFYERAAWLGYTSKVKGVKRYFEKVDLYNSSSRDRVQISMGGRDRRAVRELMHVATSLRFKGLELIKDEVVPPASFGAGEKPPDAPDSISLPQAASEPQKDQESFVELKTSRAGRPALLISVGENVQTRVSETAKTTLFTLEKSENDRSLATMTVSVSDSPPELAELIGPAEFNQERDSFTYERAAWFTWIPKVRRDRQDDRDGIPRLRGENWLAGIKGDGRLKSTAYLYNTLPPSLHRSVVHVMICGEDFQAVNDFKKVATRMRFKGVELPKANEPPNAGR